MASLARSFWVTEMWTVIAASLKGILAVAMIGGAATVVVAPALEMASSRGSAALNQPTTTPAPDSTGAPELDFETLLLACLDSYDADSQACAYAWAKSGMDRSEFRAKIVAKLAPSSPTPSPSEGPAATEKPGPTKAPVVVAAKPTTNKTDPNADFWATFEKCLATADINSDPCRRAHELSRMSAADFQAKFHAKLATLQQSQFWTYFEKCLSTRDLGSDACHKAYTLSGMSRADFEAKFKAKLAAKDGTDFWTWFEKCLDTRDENSAPCEKAQSLIGFNDADFHAKFERYLAARTASPKPSATPKPSASATPKPSATTSTFYLLVQACGESRSRSSDACVKALAASGLQPSEFWAKIEFTYGYFD